MIERGKQCKYVINIPSIEDRLQTMRAIFETFIFKTSDKNVSCSWTPWRPYCHTINLFIEFIVKHKNNNSLVTTLSKLQKTSLGILGVFSLRLYKLSVQIPIASSSGILVNKESTSRLVKYKLESCLQILLAK